MAQILLFNRFFWLICTIGLSIINLSYACQPAYEHFPKESWQKAYEGSLDASLLEFLGFTVGKTNLSSVFYELGNTELVKLQPDNKHSADVACYYDTNKKIIFESGYLAPYGEVTAIVLSSSNYYEGFQCNELKGNKATAFGGKLSLKTSVISLLKALGPPSYVDTNYIVYRYEKKIYKDDKELYISTGIEIRRKEDVIVYIRVYELVST